MAQSACAHAQQKYFFQSCQSIQTPCEVGFQVVNVFKAHGHTDQPLANASRLALRFGQAPVRGAGRVGDGGFSVAQIGGDAAHTGAVEDVERARTR